MFLIYFYILQSKKKTQEAQLQRSRDRAMLRVTEYFALSLKITQVIRNDTLDTLTWHPLSFMCRLSTFSIVIISLSRTISERQKTAWPWTLSYGSFKIIENGSIQFESLVTISYSHSIAIVAVSLADSTQYTNVTDRHRTRHRPRLCMHRAVKTNWLHINI